MPRPLPHANIPLQSPVPFAPASKPVVYVVRGRPGPNDRPALPPGSPESWGAITDHTVLDRAEYPFPIFSPCRT